MSVLICLACNGEGGEWYHTGRRYMNGVKESDWRTCYDCNGTGLSLSERVKLIDKEGEQNENAD